MKNQRNKEFEQEDLRERLQKHLKEKAIHPYLFARQNGISQATVYRLLSRMNVSINNQQKIERAIQFSEEFKLEKDCCSHEFIFREYASQAFGTCLSCGKTIMNLPYSGKIEI